MAQHSCPDCGRSFNRGSNLTRHIAEVHHPVPATCSHCGEQFRHSGLLQKHLRKCRTAASIAGSIGLGETAPSPGSPAPPVALESEVPVAPPPKAKTPIASSGPKDQSSTSVVQSSIASQRSVSSSHATIMLEVPPKFIRCRFPASASVDGSLSTHVTFERGALFCVVCLAIFDSLTQLACHLITHVDGRTMPSGPPANPLQEASVATSESFSSPLSTPRYIESSVTDGTSVTSRDPLSDVTSAGSPSELDGSRSPDSDTSDASTVKQQVLPEPGDVGSP